MRNSDSVRAEKRTLTCEVSSIKHFKVSDKGASVENRLVTQFIETIGTPKQNVIPYRGMLQPCSINYKKFRLNNRYTYKVFGRNRLHYGAIC